VPGPGNYYKDEYFGKDAKAVSISGKPKLLNQDDIPGPGQYDPILEAVK
jgi:Sperm-tail PG-rich repeat